MAGPSRAQKHLRSHAADAASSSTTADPWLSPAQDPWQCYKGAAISNDASNSKQYDALVDKLTSDVQGTLSQNCGAEFAADSHPQLGNRNGGDQGSQRHVPPLVQGDWNALGKSR